MLIRGRRISSPGFIADRLGPLDILVIVLFFDYSQHSYDLAAFRFCGPFDGVRDHHGASNGREIRRDETDGRGEACCCSRDCFYVVGGQGDHLMVCWVTGIHDQAIESMKKRCSSIPKRANCRVPSRRPWGLGQHACFLPPCNALRRKDGIGSTGTGRHGANGCQEADIEEGLKDPRISHCISIVCGSQYACLNGRGGSFD